MRASRSLGVEEEFHLIDAETSRLAPRAPQVLGALPGDGFGAELQRSTVETNTAVCRSLDELRQALLQRRQRVIAAAGELGLGVVAAGTAPLQTLVDFELTSSGRYSRMQQDYRLLVNEHLVCSLQVHVGVASRDLAVRLLPRVEVTTLLPAGATLVRQLQGLELLQGGEDRLIDPQREPPMYAVAQRDGVGAIAQRDDAEIDFADADDAGRRVLIAWNFDGRSELEILDAASTSRRICGLPGEVVSGGVLARDGNQAVLAVESSLAPPQLWALRIDDATWRPVTAAPRLERNLVRPTLERLVSHDGLELTGWLYRPAGSGRHSPAVVSVHGGPESQERPTFNPHHQMLAAAGIVVFAPNIRGSSGFGREFVHADDRFGRLNAIGDVAVCAEWLEAGGFADPTRIAVAGRSYGGYVTLMALTVFPQRFAAGIDTCGMSDLLTFYGTTEPWIARAAITKYGDPERDADLLGRLSPLHHAAALRAPLLVIHGERDTNVPVSESHQIVAALRARGHDVAYLQLDGEGHDFRRASSRRRLLLAITGFLQRTICGPEPAPAPQSGLRTGHAALDR